MRLERADSSLLGFIDTSMPEDMRAGLQSKLESCVKGSTGLEITDSAEHGEGYRFPVLHFCLYNRNPTLVRTAYYQVPPY